MTQRDAALANLLVDADSSLLELVDHLLDKGLVIDGDLVLGLADVDLIYVRLSVVLCGVDRLPGRPELGLGGGGP